MTAQIFTEWEVDSDASLAWPFAAIADRCGIYWLDFANGESYVGQSVGVVSRLSTHRRRWPDIRRVRFLECDQAELDQRERDVIRLVESHIPLRNKNLTNQPQGINPIAVEIVAGESVILPWARQARRKPAVGDRALNPVPASNGQKLKRARLSRMPEYIRVCELLTLIAAEVVTDPVRSQRTLWTMSALPATSRGPGLRRLATVSAGILELAWVMQESDETGNHVSVVLNVDGAVNQKLLTAELRAVGIKTKNENVLVYRANYRSDSQVAGVYFANIADAATAMSSPILLDSMYRLAVRSMRRGTNPQRRYHNPLLAHDVLASFSVA